MTSAHDIVELSEKWIRITNKLALMERKKNIDYGSGDLLNTTEIHLIQAIGKNQNINVTSLAKQIGLTKGAISQIISKFESNNIVQKYKNSNNEKTTLLRLTPKGQIAFHGHEQYHMKIYSQIQTELGPISDENFLFLNKFLDVIDNALDKSLQE